MYAKALKLRHATDESLESARMKSVLQTLTAFCPENMRDVMCVKRVKLLSRAVDIYAALLYTYVGWGWMRISSVPNWVKLGGAGCQFVRIGLDWGQLRLVLH